MLAQRLLYGLLLRKRHVALGARVVRVTVVLAALLGTILSLLVSLPMLPRGWFLVLFWAQLGFGFFFLLEYVLRIYSYGLRSRGFFTILRFALTWDTGLILITALAFLLPVVLDLNEAGFGAIACLRFISLSQMANLGPLSRTVKLFGSIIYERRHELLVTLFLSLLALIVTSVGMYLFEHKGQPEAFGSIISSMWWSVVTLTTVGYGDAIPQTVGGRVFAGLTSVVGVAIVAMPTAILSASLIQRLSKKRGSPRSITCPHCHQKIFLITEEKHQVAKAHTERTSPS